MSLHLKQFRQGTDNWGFIFYNDKSREAACLDPLEASLYLKFLESQKLVLKNIFITHYHWDHIKGVEEILKGTSSAVCGPDQGGETPSYIEKRISSNESILFDNFPIQAIQSPGHSKSHLIYSIPKLNWLFCGDLLFNLGCGRIIDGQAEDLFESLQLLKDFSPATKLYFGHDYREKNLAFAKNLDPHYYAPVDTEDLEEHGTLESELWWNPFLRTQCFDEWLELRKLRNSF
jgi:hydroxyacylglutathione hydrolase